MSLTPTPLMTALRRAARVFAFALPALVFVACDDVISDPTFREWCGDTLCAWTLVEGHIEKAPTWTDKDYGVAFTATPTTISQTVSDSPQCLQFATIANIDATAQMTIAIDFDSDGSIDFSQPIGSAAWTEVLTLATAPASYDGFTLYVKKEGPGNAVLAQVRVQSATNCAAPPVVLGKLQLGEPCGTFAGALSGAGDPDGGASCETGLCVQGKCAECAHDSDCRVAASDAGDASAGDGGVPHCAIAALQNDSAYEAELTLPLQCNAGARSHASGAPCIADDDCASGACVGVLTRGAEVTPDGSVACEAGVPNDGSCVISSVVGGHCR